MLDACFEAVRDDDEPFVMVMALMGEDDCAAPRFVLRAAAASDDEVPAVPHGMASSVALEDRSRL